MVTGGWELGQCNKCGQLVNDVEIREIQGAAEHSNPTASHDECYRGLKIQPCDVTDQFMACNLGDITPVQAYDICVAIQYLMRAGRKGDDWRQDVQKAENHLHRARVGQWPWGVSEDD